MKELVYQYLGPQTVKVLVEHSGDRRKGTGVEQWANVWGFHKEKSNEDCVGESTFEHWVGYFNCKGLAECKIAKI